MVTDAVHAKGGYIYAQLWHCGRVALPQHTGMPTISASADPWASNDPHPYPPPGTDEYAMYKDFPPNKLDEQGIRNTIDEMRIAARNAMTAGFDGVEIHGANGYRECHFDNKLSPSKLTRSFLLTAPITQYQNNSSPQTSTRATTSTAARPSAGPNSSWISSRRSHQRSVPQTSPSASRHSVSATRRARRTVSKRGRVFVAVSCSGRTLDR